MSEERQHISDAAWTAWGMYDKYRECCEREQAKRGTMVVTVAEWEKRGDNLGMYLFQDALRAAEKKLADRDAEIEGLRRSVSYWEDDAGRYCDNTDYWRKRALSAEGRKEVMPNERTLAGTGSAFVDINDIIAEDEKDPVKKRLLDEARILLKQELSRREVMPNAGVCDQNDSHKKTGHVVTGAAHPQNANLLLLPDPDHRLGRG